MTQQNTQKYDDTWQKAFAAANITGADWLTKTRSKALDTFLQGGFPSTREEAWRYTDLSKVEARSHANLTQTDEAASPDAAGGSILAIPDAVRLVFVNGHFDREQSQLVSRPGLTLSIFSETMPDGDFIRKSLDELATRSPLTALNTALAADAIAIELEENCQLDTPIYVVWINTLQRTNTYPRCMVQLGKSSRATLIEHHLSNGAAFSNSVTELMCADSAQLQYTKLQDEDRGAHHIGFQRIKLQANSQLALSNLDLGAEIARNDLSIELLGSGAEAHTHGLYLLDGQRHADNHVYLRHLAPHTNSTTNYRGVMSGQSKGVFNGSIYVEQDAQKTDAQLSNHNLLLSPKAEINTKPELEIYADDVKCAHGATTGRLDSTALFYLLTRGIPKDQAEQMLIAAFAQEITSNIKIDAINERILKAVANRLANVRIEAAS